MNPFDTTKYTLKRNPDNTIVRVDGLGGEEKELTVDYCNDQIAFHQQVVANFEAQRDKILAFEAENPPFELPEETEE